MTTNHKVDSSTSRNQDNYVLHYIPSGNSIIIPISDNYKVLALLKPIEIVSKTERIYNVSMSIAKDIKPYVWHEFEDELILKAPINKIYSIVSSHVKKLYELGELSIHMYNADRVYSLMEKAGDYLSGATDEIGLME